MARLQWVGECRGTGASRPVPDQGVDGIGAIRADLASKSWIALDKFFDRQEVGDAGSADAHGTVRTPGRLELEGRPTGIRLGRLDPEPVGNFDQRSVAGVGGAVAVVIGSDRPHAGLVEIPQGYPHHFAPGLVADTYAL